MGPIAVVQPWGHKSTKFREESIKFVNAKKVLLPTAYEGRPIMIEDNGTRIFNMAVTPGRGLKIRLLIE